MPPPAATAAGSSLRSLVPTVEQPEPDSADTLLRSTRAMRDAAGIIDRQAAEIRSLRRQRVLLGILLALAAYL